MSKPFFRSAPRFNQFNIDEFSRAVEVAEETYALFEVRKNLPSGRGPTDALFKALHEAALAVHEQLVRFLFTY
jgi:hypothetical protein